MNKLLPVVVATLGFFAASGAKAADAALPMKAFPTPIEPPFSWTGFYLGANGGGGSAWSHSRVTQATPFGPTSFCCGLGLAGGILGGQAGFNYEFPSHWLIGIEGDGDWAQISRSSSGCPIFKVGLSPALPPDAQQTTSHSTASRLCAAVWATHSTPVQASPRVCCCMVPADGHGANYRATARPPAWACFVRAPPFRLPVVGPLSTIPPMVGQQVPDWKSPLRGTGPPRRRAHPNLSYYIHVDI
jgi:opacity protein-like surface antigen